MEISGGQEREEINCTAITTANAKTAAAAAETSPTTPDKPDITVSTTCIAAPEQKSFQRLHNNECRGNICTTMTVEETTARHQAERTPTATTATTTLQTATITAATWNSPVKIMPTPLTMLTVKKKYLWKKYPSLMRTTKTIEIRKVMAKRSHEKENKNAEEHIG